MNKATQLRYNMESLCNNDSTVLSCNYFIFLIVIYCTCCAA